MKQLLDRQEEDLSFIPESSKEEELELNIDGLDNLSDESYSAPLLYALNYNYNEHAQTDLNALTNQRSIIVDETYLISRFKEPVAIDMDQPEFYLNVLNTNVLSGESYIYWGADERANVLIFFQKMDHPIFYNQNAVLLIQLNDDGEMTQYVQTRLEKEEGSEEEQDLIQQYDAVSRLYHNTNDLRTGDTINGAQLGYHNLISLPNGNQVLNPTWNITVNGNQHYFINALEGHDYSQSNHFLREITAKFTEVLDNTRSGDFEFFHTENAEEEAKLLNTVKQSLISVYHNIIEVDTQ